jgi:hypothetical protein
VKRGETRVARGGGKLRSGPRLWVSLALLRAKRGSDEIKRKAAGR